MRTTLFDWTFQVKIYLLSLADPVSWIIDKNANSIADLACGRGLPMRKIRARMRVKYALGVDLFEPYLQECKQFSLHDKYLRADIRKLPLTEKSFDVVIALQVLEHLHKNEAWKVLEKMEKIARKQIIIAVPCGRTYHPAVDGNRWQLHKSSFEPGEFRRLEYKIIRVGRKEIMGETGLIKFFTNSPLKVLLHGVNLLTDLITLLIQPLANYYFVAYKEIDAKK